MATYTSYKNLEKPLSTEKYNVGVANKNNDVIDSELHKLDLKNESQDALLATKEALSQHENNSENPHNVSKAQIGLGNVDNTADLDKPVSAAQREAINDIYVQTNSYVDLKISNVVDGAPETLDTLKKLADALDEKHGELGGEILKTIEEVKENTDENNLVSAVVVGELINDLNQYPDWIYDAEGKITGYKTPGGADAVFPFSDAGYSISGSAISASYYNTGSVGGVLPLKGIRHLKFSYSFTNYFKSGTVTLIGSQGNKTIVSVSNGGAGTNQSGTYDQDLNEEYEYLSASVTAGQSGYCGMAISNVVARC